MEFWQSNCRIAFLAKVNPRQSLIEFAFCLNQAHQGLMAWDLVAAAFDEQYGALRDIYVLETTISDWQFVIDELIGSSFSIEYRIGGKTADIPIDISAVFARSQSDSSPELRIILGGMSLNCYFFTEREIEFDLDPGQMRPELFPKLIDFMRLLRKAAGKPVILAHENSPEATILRIEPVSGRIEYSG